MTRRLVQSSVQSPMQSSVQSPALRTTKGL